MSRVMIIVSIFANKLMLGLFVSTDLWYSRPDPHWFVDHRQISMRDLSL